MEGQTRDGLTHNRFICIHAHFYQPPRENPWIEEILPQSSAHPYADWNQRIQAECYRPNRAARILNTDGLIHGIVNNYAGISFNCGPTLLNWMKEEDPETYEAILGADQASQMKFSGHGSALAQAFNHSILPLHKKRDKYTQVYWGLRDFETHFGREAEGLWLPETAVDLETLEVLAELGVQFTVLAPHQAGRIRGLASTEEWVECTQSPDFRQPHRCYLPSGASISIFFYNGFLSHQIAFGELLRSGELMAERLLSTLDPIDEDPQIVAVAMDGETFGHHHPFGEMALAHCLDEISRNRDACLTNFGEYLSQFAPTHLVEIREKTSWSCSHGLGRWSEDCGCQAGRGSNWKQTWRKPLRDLLTWLGQQCDQIFEEEGSKLFLNPWEARNQYVHLFRERSASHLARSNFVRQHLKNSETTHAERVQAFKLLEMQRHGQLMFTSCGWFFDEVSDLETVQVLQYGARVIELASELSFQLESEFLSRLRRVPSNLYRHAGIVYQDLVSPTRFSVRLLAGVWAAQRLLGLAQESQQLFGYHCREKAGHFLRCRSQLWFLARVELESIRTSENRIFSVITHCGGPLIAHSLELNTSLDDGWPEPYLEQLSFGKPLPRTLLVRDFGLPLSLSDFPYTISGSILNPLVRHWLRKGEPRISDLRALLNSFQPTSRAQAVLSIGSAQDPILDYLIQALERALREGRLRLQKEILAVMVGCEWKNGAQSRVWKTLEQWIRTQLSEWKKNPLDSRQLQVISQLVAAAGEFPKNNLWHIQTDLCNALSDLNDVLWTSADLQKIQEIGQILQVSVGGEGEDPDILTS